MIDIVVFILISVFIFISYLLPLLFPVVIVFWLKNKNKHDLQKEEEIVRKIIRLDPDFNVIEFKEEAAKCFIKVKESIIRNDLKTLMTLETTELYNKHKSELDMTKITGVIDAEHIEDVNKIIILGSKIENNLEKITLRINVKFKKLKIDRKQAALVYLDETTTLTFLCLQFVRNCNVKTKKGKEFALQSCPNCGATVNITSQGSCTYCKSVLINGNHSWVLNKIDNYYLFHKET